jgi:O-antigen/teichoic acid export membrane protein
MTPLGRSSEGGTGAGASGQAPIETEPTTVEDVKSRMLLGVRWVAATRVLSEAMLFASGVVLARLIAPAEYGQAIVALVIANFATVLVTNAFSALLVQQQDLTEDDVRASVALNIGIGLILSLLVFALAGPLSALSNHSPASLVRIVAPVCVLSGVRAVPSAMLSRRLDFQNLSMIDALMFVTQTVVSVGLATLGGGASAIVIGALAGRVASTAATVVAYPPPLPKLHRGSLRSQVSFGTPNALQALIFTGFQNEDFAIIGARLGPTQLAFYYRAFTYGVDYQTKISRILVEMAFPIYSRLGSLDEIRALRTRIVRAHAAVLFPILATYAVLAPTLVPWLLGQRWAPVVLPSQLLVVAGAVSTLLTGNGALILALGRADLLLYWNIGHMIAYGLVIYFVAPLGLAPVAGVAAGFYVLHGLAVHWLLLGRIARIPMSDLAGELLGPCTASAALILCSITLRVVLDRAGAPPVVTLLLAGGVGVAAYLLCLRLAFRKLWSDLELLTRRTLRHSDRPQRPRPAEPAVVPLRPVSNPAATTRRTEAAENELSTTDVADSSAQIGSSPPDDDGPLQINRARQVSPYTPYTITPMPPRHANLPERQDDPDQ